MVYSWISPPRSLQVAVGGPQEASLGAAEASEPHGAAPAAGALAPAAAFPHGLRRGHGIIRKACAERRGGGSPSRIAKLVNYGWMLMVNGYMNSTKEIQ